MTRKNKRIILISTVIVIITIIVAVLLATLSKNIMFFMTPSEIKQTDNMQNQVIRVGGLVKKNSFTRVNLQIEFIITDCKHNIKVYYSGLLPSLFREGQGIIATGKIQNNILYATELLTKHDEKYIPKELHEATIDHNSCNDI